MVCWKDHLLAISQLLASWNDRVFSLRWCISITGCWRDRVMLQERSMHVWYVRAPWSDVRVIPCELSPSGLHLCLIASATVSDTCNESINPFITRPWDMTPFTHHQRPCLPGSPTHVVIQPHLQLSLLQHRTDGFDVDLSLHPCCQVSSMKYLSRWWQSCPNTSCSQIC